MQNSNRSNFCLDEDVSRMGVKFIQARSQAAGSTIVRQGEDDAASINFWGCSSAGRAPALQAGGQEFDSPHLQSFF